MENKEIIEVEAEEVTNESFALTVAKQVDKKVASLDKFDVRFKELREKFSKIQIKDASDRAGYDAAKKAKAELKDMWVGSDNDREVAKRPLIDANKLLENKFQWVIAELHAIAAPIEERIKWFESEKKKKDEEEKAMKDKRLQERVLALLAMGAVNDGVKVTLDDYSADIALIRDTNEDIYKAKVYLRFYETWEAKEKVRKAKKEADELADKLKKEEQEAFELQKKKLKEDQDKVAEDLRKAEEAKEKLKKELVAVRSKELFALGMTYDYAEDEWVLGGITLSHFTLAKYDEAEWAKWIEEATPLVEAQKASIQEAGLKELERIKQKAIEDAEILRKAAELKLEEERKKLASEASGKVKYKDLFDYLKKAPVYEFESNHFKAKYRIIRDFLADLK